MSHLLPARPQPPAGELWRKWLGAFAFAAALAFVASPVALAASSRGTTASAAQPAGHAAPAAEGKAEHPAQAEHGATSEGGHEEGSIWGFVGKIVNFALLVGTLVYFLRAPVSGYLATRRIQVRADLDAAEAMKRSAAQQIAEMEAKLQALPRELEELKARGQAEIAAEEARIRELAEAERIRLVEQASREIDQQVRMAQRALVEHAADLSVSVAEAKIKREITSDDQVRLVKAYLDQVNDHE
jgi:F-type H+-transporting ATPase subunit b